MRKDSSRSTKMSGTGKMRNAARGAVGRGSTRQAVKEQPSRWPRLLALALALTSLLFALFYISPLFRVSKVTVVGAMAVASDKVASAADVEGQNILAVNRDEVVKSVGQIPMVKSARVTRKLPNEVVITVEERRPWSVWKARDAEYVIDDEGVVISATTSSQGLVTIVDMDSQTVRIGSRVEPRVVELALKLSQLLPKEIAAVPKRFEYTQVSGLTVVSDKGWRARFGDGEDLAYQLSTLKAVLTSVAQRNTKVEVIDLRYKGRPYYR